SSGRSQLVRKIRATTQLRSVLAHCQVRNSWPTLQVADGSRPRGYLATTVFFRDGYSTKGVAMAWVFGVDSSYDLLTEEKAQKLKDAGVAVYVQALSALPPPGVEQPASRVISLRNAWSVGLSIAGYSLLGGGPRSPTSYMDFARGGVPEDLW